MLSGLIHNSCRFTAPSARIVVKKGFIVLSGRFEVTSKFNVTQNPKLPKAHAESFLIHNPCRYSRFFIYPIGYPGFRKQRLKIFFIAGYHSMITGQGCGGNHHIGISFM